MFTFECDWEEVRKLDNQSYYEEGARDTRLQALSYMIGECHVLPEVAMEGLKIPRAERQFYLDQLKTPAR